MPHVGGGSAVISPRGGGRTEATHTSLGQGFSPSLAWTNRLASLWVFPSYPPSPCPSHWFTQ